MRPYRVVVDALGFDDPKASASVMKTCSFRHSSRMRPLKLSTKLFCIGLPGAM